MNYSVNLSSGQTVEVVIGEAAQINVEQALNYIESGRVEITKYVNEWAKPEIANYTKEYAEPIVTEIVNQTTKPLIDDYLNTTTKPQIDEYVADNVKPYADSAQDSAAKAKISKDNAKTSETNAKASELAAASSAGVASAAAVTATEAKDYTANVLTDENLKTVGQDLQSADSNIKAVATNILNVNTVAKNIDNVNLLAPHTEAMEALAPDIMDVVTVAGISEQTKNVSDNMTAVVDVSNNKTNINNVASNITAVNNVSENMADVKNAVQSANDAKLWAVGTKTEKPEGSSKYWAEQAKNAVQTPDASETVKGIVRLATSEEVTAGTNDSSAITPLKLKQTIAQDLTNPSTNTVPSTKAVSDESSRIVSIMDTELAKKLGVNATTIGETTDLRTPRLNEGNTSTVYIDGYVINSEDDINGCLVAPVLFTDGKIGNRLMVRKKINGNNVYRGLTIGIKADGSIFTDLEKNNDENSILTNVSHGTNYVRLGNGLQICWGNSPNNRTITLPQAFKNNTYRVTFCQTENSPHSYNNTVVDKTTTSFKFINGYAGDWIAIGWWY